MAGALAGIVVLVLSLGGWDKGRLRALFGLGGGEPSGLKWISVDPADLAGTELTEEAARSLFPPLAESGSRVQFDPVASVVLRPDMVRTFDWPEHPAGHVTMRSNNLGFREDRPTVVAKAGPRVLVLGDSHTDGVIDNADNLAHVLERLLDEDAAAAGTAPVEVLNAAVGGTGPHEYVGQLRKHLDLLPDLVIAVIYTGNDFANALLLSDYATKRHRKPRDAGYRRPLDAAAARWPLLVPQGFNQPCEFRYWSGDDELALVAALDDLLVMRRLCDGIGSRLLVTILPSLADVQPHTDRATVDAILQTLALTPEEFGINLRLGQRLIGELASRGIPCLDPSAAMAASDTPLYWRADHHLGFAGHALLGRLLHARIVSDPALRP